MKTQLTILEHAARTWETTEPVLSRKPVLALVMRLLWVAALVLPVVGARSAVVFTSLYSFTGTNDGAYPNGLVQGSDGNFYGTTEFASASGWDGGLHEGGYGTVFKISANGALTTLYTFGSITNASGDALDGVYPNGLVQGSDGYFYGTTWAGGTNNLFGGVVYPGNGAGTVLKISTNGVLATLYSFTGGNDGANPTSGLVQGRDRDFYGFTSGGGNTSVNNGYGDGTVFKISTNGALTTLYTFGSITNANGNALDGALYGSSPPDALVQGSDGNLYGTTFSGGTNGGFYGTVFKITTGGALTSLYSFTGGNDGAYPRAGLVQGRDGNFYGTTWWGGTNGDGGTVFKIGTNGVFTTLYLFGSVQDTNGLYLDGANPWAGLVQASDGYFCGTTEWGGAYTNQYGQGAGTVFKISTNGTLTTLYSFTGGNDGANPTSGLVQGRDGDFYGTTVEGGASKMGTVFRLTIVPDPQLSIIPSDPYIILSWPTNYGIFSYAGYTLESTTNLGSSAVWTKVASEPVFIGGQNVVVNPISGTQQFFRLSQ